MDLGPARDESRWSRVMAIQHVIRSPHDLCRHSFYDQIITSRKASYSGLISKPISPVTRKRF
ncbi:hypothetical protein E2C01_066548 [Portunus trituberculatus]|uniref:Uncharacterized protein n=1 Tax=Portunus trituberculatus TaxID=210409 RepID=A0A5B7HR70_PORTR|nr:hypothetical protein [Portunus trituberculatus]